MNNNTWFDHPVLRRALSLLAALVMVAGILPAAAVADDAQYGYVNFDDVRFRRQANSTTVWAMLDEGWVVEIRDEKRSGGVDYYYVRTNIPKHTDREYYGYISQEYITLMTAEEVADWMDKGGNGGEFSPSTEPDAENPAVMTSYARPNNASTNYYSFDGSSLTSLGLLSADEAYYVSGSSTISEVAYYIINVGGVNCYARADAMTMITTGDDEQDTPATAPEGAIGVIRLTGKKTTNFREEAVMLSDNIIRKIPYDTELPYYSTVKSDSKLWYRCYDAQSGEYGYILGTYAKVISTVETEEPEAPAATPKPDSSQTAIGMVKIRPSGSTNIRKEPKTNTKNVAAQAEQGEVLPYYATSVVDGSRWYYVYYAPKDVFGYVLGTCVTIVDESVTGPTTAPSATEMPSSGYIVLTAGGVNLRESYSTSSQRLGQYDKGDVFPYYATQQKGDTIWYKVVTDKGQGWFHGDFCAISDKNGNEIGSANDTTGGYILTTIDNLYLRKKANPDAGVYGKIKKEGTLLQTLGKAVKGGNYTWYNVEYEGNIGYVRGDCVRVLTDEEAEAYKATGTLPTPTPSPTPVPKPTEYIITTLDNVWIRKAPSTDAKTAGQVRKGTVLQFNDTTKVGGVLWYEITFDGATRYIKGSCVKVMTDAEYNKYLASLPTPTPTPSPTPPPDPATLSDIALTNMEKVIVRADGDADAKRLTTIYNEGTECKLLGKTKKDDEYTWYNVKVKGTTGWIRGDLLRILTKTEAEMYDKLGDPDAKPEASYSTLQIGSTGDAVTALQNRLVQLGYLKSTQVTGVYDVNTRNAIEDFQEAEKLTVDGIAGSATQHALFGTVEEGYYDKNNGSSTSVKLYKPELIDWYKGGIQSIFYKGAVATVTDVRTGISFKVKRWSGAHHADVEPLTAADTAAMCRIYKVDDAQEISDKNYYHRRPILVTINGHSYCASMYGIPHNYPDGDTISGNDFYGQFCIHFTNSQLHDGKGVDKPSSKNSYFCHADAIAEAYETAAEKLNIK